MKKEHILHILAIFLFSFSLSCKKQESRVEDINFLPQIDTGYMQAQETIYSYLVDIRKKSPQHYYEETGDYCKTYQYLKEILRRDKSLRNFASRCERKKQAFATNKT